MEKRGRRATASVTAMHQLDADADGDGDVLALIDR